MQQGFPGPWGHEGCPRVYIVKYCVDSIHNVCRVVSLCMSKGPSRVSGKLGLVVLLHRAEAVSAGNEEGRM